MQVVETHSAHVLAYTEQKIKDAKVKNAALNIVTMTIVKGAGYQQYTLRGYQNSITRDIQFVNKCIAGLPHTIRKKLLDGYVKRHNSDTAINRVRGANIYIRNASKPYRRILKSSILHFLGALYDAEKREAAAIVAANQCTMFIQQAAKKQGGGMMRRAFAYAQCQRFADRYSIDLPALGDKPDADKYDSALVRVMTDKWWQRKLNKSAAQVIERMYLQAGFIKKGAMHYVSNYALNEHQNQVRQNADFINAMAMQNIDTGEKTDLADIASKTAANPEIRRAELMVRANGLEQIAQKEGNKAFFVTWTAPSRYHASSKKYTGETPKQVQKYLCTQWAKARAAIHRRNIPFYGIRVTEPHADACPHWHLLIFTPEQYADKVKAILTKYACEHEQGEIKKTQYRIDIKDQDLNKGSAVAYITKYIAKNVDGAKVNHLADHETDQAITDSVDRVTAWARLWDIRQFQFFGCERVSVWRELRKIKTPLDLEIPAAEHVRYAADAGDWYLYTLACRDNDIDIDYIDAENEHGETIKKINGLWINGEQVITRTDSYILCKKGDENPSSCMAAQTPKSPANAETAHAGGLGLKAGDSLRPWTCVNNCTRQDNRRGASFYRRQFECIGGRETNKPIDFIGIRQRIAKKHYTLSAEQINKIMFRPQLTLNRPPRPRAIQQKDTQK
jgi:hypothetical protein